MGWIELALILYALYSIGRVLYSRYLFLKLGPEQRPIVAVDPESKISASLTGGRLRGERQIQTRSGETHTYTVYSFENGVVDGTPAEGLLLAVRWPWSLGAFRVPFQVAGVQHELMLGKLEVKEVDGRKIIFLDPRLDPHSLPAMEEAAMKINEQLAQQVNRLHLENQRLREKIGRLHKTISDQADLIAEMREVARDWNKLKYLIDQEEVQHRLEQSFTQRLEEVMTLLGKMAELVERMAAGYTAVAREKEKVEATGEESLLKRMVEFLKAPGGE